MSFTRVNAGSWAVGDKLTSAQMNSLDIDHANSVDKTTAGDTIAGSIIFTGAGKINAGSAGQVFANAAGAVQSTVNGGFQHAGGATDWVSFSANRSRVLAQTPELAVWSALAGGVGVITGTYTSGNGQVNVGSTLCSQVNSSSASQFSFVLPIRALHNGATLTQAVLTLKGVGGHAALPASMPAFGIFRATVTSPGSAPGVLLTSTFVVDPSITTAAYQVIHTITFTPNQGNFIDTTQYDYYAVVWDEGGANALVGTLYGGIQLTYSAISNMAFP